MTVIEHTHLQGRAGAELEDRLDRIRDLVRLRRLFIVFGAKGADIEACNAEIDDQRRRIADLARYGSESLRAA